jgi:hypothetical protein
MIYEKYSIVLIIVRDVQDFIIYMTGKSSLEFIDPCDLVNWVTLNERDLAVP